MTRQQPICGVIVALLFGLVSEATAQPAPLDLRGWLELARSRAPALAVAAARVEEETGRLGVARSMRGPRLDAGFIYLRFKNPPALDLGSLGSYSPLLENNYLAQLSVTQPLFTFGRIWAGIEAAKFSARAAESYRAQVEVELTAAVAHAYDDVLLARALVDVARRSVEVLDEAVRVADEHYDAGTVSRLDVLRAETRVSTARSAERAQLAALASANERLAALVGLDADRAPPVSGVLEHTVVQVDIDSLLARARLARPDVQALHELARASAAQADAAGAARLPAVSLYAATLVTRPELITGEASWSWELLGGVNVSWRFFDSGETGGRVRAARAAASRAEAEASQAVDAAVAAVRAEARELERSAEDVATGLLNVDRAERALEIADDRYTSGIGIQLEVLEAESDLTAARVDLLRSIHANRAALIELRRVAGFSADAPLAGVNSGEGS